jgi:hypothetical protein
LSLSPYANAREYYDQRKSAAIKEQKTLQSSTKALKSTEQKIQQDLKKGLKQEKAVLRPVRRQMWFEKFSYFISSDGYLVLGGRDAQQNEIIYKRYLKKGDVYLHSDVQGAAVVIIKNNPATPDAPIPPSTLSQAGTLVVASSSAWDSKAGMSAWWVNADQVSKSAPTGEYLPAGSFSVRGKKNFLPPAQLVLGFGVMFHISDESKAKHVKHRIQDENPLMGSAKVAKLAEQKLAQQAETAQQMAGETNEQANETDQQDSDASDEEEEKPDDRANPLQPSHEEDESSTPATPEDEQSSPVLEKQLGELSVNDDVQPENVAADGEDDEGASPEEEEEDGSASAPPVAASTASTAKKGPAPPKRGKRGKAKKIAAKYANQDEEDRLAAQALIGAAAGREKAAAEAAAKAAREAEAAFQKERRRAQHLRAQQQIAEHEEKRKAMLEEGAEIDDDEDIKQTPLDSFVGMALPGDEILDAIPVCAPWAAMGRFKYKVKLQPGTQKKGKALKEILGKWAIDAGGKHKGWVDQESRDVERMWPREVELLSAFKAEELGNVIPVKTVRIMLSGGMAGAAKGATGGKGRGGKGSKKR